MQYKSNMWQDLLLVHRPSKHELELPDSSVLWSTCLRQLAFLPATTEITGILSDQDQVFRGLDAYRFCLEICCGLYSPILGETEVFGQFRQFFLNLPRENSFANFLRSFAEQVIADTKQVRQEHLLNLGAQSYGSLLRRMTADSRSVTLLGAGQLSEEILPWLEGKTIRIVCRRASQGQELARQFPGVTVHSFSEKLLPSDAILVAAPIPASEFMRWFENQAMPKVLVDLRGEAVLDPLSLSSSECTLVSLNDLFRSMERQKGAQDARVSQAREQIQKLVARLEERVRTRAEHRPFGWEDVCA